jgi:endonuclease III
MLSQNQRSRSESILGALMRCYPDATCALHFRSPFELLVATILSAQCTDARVNQVTPSLFSRWPGPKELSQASQDEVEEVIRPTGFYKNKAKALLRASSMIMEKFGGAVPETLDSLVELPGVARKTANVVLGVAFQKSEGIVVDRHVARLSKRMGITSSEDPETIEQDLMRIVAKAQWTIISHALIHHGRVACTARKPLCGSCAVANLCPKIGL